MAHSTSRPPPIVFDDAWAAPDQVATLVDPYDLPGTDEAAWFPQITGVSGARTPNEVVGYTHPEHLFPDIASALRTATESSHFILIAGWNMRGSWQLVDGDPASTPRALLAEAAGKGVQIRVLLYRQNPRMAGNHIGNRNEVAFINTLPTAVGIDDSKVVHGSTVTMAVAGWFGLDYVGAHHQKLIIVLGGDGLIAFQGGVDLDPNRTGPNHLHDVHTRVRGFAALSLWDLFAKRWTDHPDAVAAERARKLPPLTRSISFTAPPIERAVSAEVGATFPNSIAHPLHGPSRRYEFAPSGERTVRQLVLHAIANAREFIYLEDQYLVDMRTSDALCEALGRIKKLIILISTTNTINGELFQAWRRRKDFIDPLYEAGGTAKVQVCHLAGQFVHAKAWIFDDRYAIVGSANCNRRGYTHDSEHNLGIYDENARRDLFFAHELRMQLWAKHLQRPAKEMLDPIAASVHWARPIGKVIRYNQNEDTDSIWTNDDGLWNEGIDPSGA